MMHPMHEEDMMRIDEDEYMETAGWKNTLK